MAKNPRKKTKKATYDVGYGKPPKEFQWKKGCSSPNPKGRPKKIKTLKEALQVAFSTEINTKTESGDVKKITCIEALAKRTIADAISKDGPTRRMLYRNDIFNLLSKEQEIEYDKNEEELIRIENEYGKLLHIFAEMSPKMRDTFRNVLNASLIDLLNNKEEEE